MVIDEREGLIDRLRYQVRVPQVTTMGPCANDCGNYARGSGVCRYCLTDKLAEHIGKEKATALRRALEAEQAARYARMDAEAEAASDE